VNCRDSESLILAERDGRLTTDQLAALSDHVAACAACRELRARLATATDAYHRGLNAVEAPDAAEAWRELQGRLHRKQRPLAPMIWFGVPLAAAAAAAFALFVTRPAAPAPAPAAPMAATVPYDSSVIAGADFVEAGDPNASTLVFVDKESGWLVVWAADPGDAKTSG
jgi:anti-sigma factor RsiW